MKTPAWLLPKRPKRLLLLVGLLGAVLIGEHFYRQWQPTHSVTTAHYRIQSSAQPAQTADIGVKVETLHTAYFELFGAWTNGQSQPRLEMKLFRNRDEFRRCNRGVGWAEAFYRPDCCYGYYSAEEINPYHWMLHEAVHQLNHEVAHLHLAKWADEGLSAYFSSSLLVEERLDTRHVDRNTYPVWWLADLQLTGQIDRDLQNGTVIPLRAILTGHGGPSLNKQFNLYYLHWWSLMHLLLNGNDAKYRPYVLPMLEEGATPESFEKHIGPIDRLQAEWYQHLCELQWDLFRIGPTDHSKPRSVSSSSSSPK